MSSQYPPPPTDETQYAPIYPATPNNQLLDGQQQSHLQYSPPNIFPKIENLSDVLQQQAHQANDALSDQRALGPHAAASADQQQSKPNRLRKACDSCSIRKVKVGDEGSVAANEAGLTSTDFNCLVR